jgi:hypothetical protein
MLELAPALREYEPAARRPRPGQLAVVVLFLISIAATAAITAHITATTSRAPALYSVWRSYLSGVVLTGGELGPDSSGSALQRDVVAIDSANSRGGGIALGLQYALPESSQANEAASYLGQINGDLDSALQVMVSNPGSISAAKVEYVGRIARLVLARLPGTISSEGQLGDLAPRIVGLEQSIKQQLASQGL